MGRAIFGCGSAGSAAPRLSRFQIPSLCSLKKLDVAVQGVFALSFSAQQSPKLLASCEDFPRGRGARPLGAFRPLQRSIPHGYQHFLERLRQRDLEAA